MATDMDTTKLVTAREFIKIPDDGCRMELIAGKVTTRRYAWWNEGLAGTAVLMSLVNHLEESDLDGLALASGVGYHIKSDPDHVRVPNVAYIKQERMDVEEPDFFFPGAPDSAFENVTTCDTYYYVADKVRAWFETGAGMVIVINVHNKSVMVHHSLKQATMLTAGDTVDGGDVLPGWSMPVADIFK